MTGGIDGLAGLAGLTPLPDGKPGEQERELESPAPLPTTLPTNWAAGATQVLNLGRLADPGMQDEVEAIVRATPVGHGNARINWRYGTGQNDVIGIVAEKIQVGDKLHISVVGTAKYDFLAKDVAVGFTLDGSW